MAKGIRFPFQNTALTNLPRERWKDIYKYEGYYQISNYGRVRAEQRKVIGEGGRVYHYQEKILKSKLHVNHNKTLDRPTYKLFIGITRENKTHHFSVARLVYHAFINPFDLRDHNILITHKDFEGRNNYFSNLEMSDSSRKMILSYDAGRITGPIPKSVTQFDQTGKPIDHYASILEAAKKTGFGNRGISNAAHGKIHIYKSYFWRFGKQKKKIELGEIKRNAQSKNDIHEFLVKRLKIRNVNPKAIPPYLNLSVKTMKGEQWKDMPGYRGLYQVSNLGRVKALQKITFGKQQKWRPEQIQRSIVDFRKDKKGKEIAGTIVVAVSKNGEKRLVTVARWVYYLFVKKFAIDDPTTQVTYKGGNPLHVHHKNLLLTRGGKG